MSDFWPQAVWLAARAGLPSDAPGYNAWVKSCIEIIEAAFDLGLNTPSPPQTRVPEASEDPG